ncbi:MAG TPA: ribose-phosphate diphosphokinase [Candidatus Sulfotelmatobacter sp.]|jgi:ribose-phosphate pyrophosphokinase|nr:ribose-phosphate diphosphokinase [Candidatus Sulfotelmatobacter sp.]
MPRQNDNNLFATLDKDEFILLTGRANLELAASVGKILNTEVTCPISSFSDGELRVRIQPNLRRRMVFLLQPTSSPVNDHIMELILMADAAKRASASEITAVIPYFGYARQDRKEMSRVPISASAIATLLINAGVDRIVTIDVHSEQLEGSIKQPWDNLFASYSLLPAIKKLHLKDLVVASPDKGGFLQAAAYAKLLQTEGIAIAYKQRDIAFNDVSNTLGMIGEVKDKDVLLVDDIIGTAGTIVHAANFMKQKGARNVLVAAAHGVFSGDALQKINASGINELIISDTIRPREEVLKNKKITIVSVAPLLAEAIRRIKTGESISKALIL